MTKNKVNQTIKRKKNMVIHAIACLIFGIIMGFLLTLIVSIFKSYKSGLLSALSDLLTAYSDLVLEIAGRSPSLAGFILDKQALIEAEASNSLISSGNFVAAHFPKLASAPAPSQQISLVLAKIKYYLAGLFYLIQWSFKVDLLKFISVFCSSMVFVFAALLGFLDGLLARYIRTAEGGRESTYVYHHLADAIFKTPFYLIVVYLALPLPLSPLLIVAMITLLTFMFCRLSAANLKKFI